MPGGGTRTFVDSDTFEASLRQAQIAAVIVPQSQFRARLTWAELHHLQVLRCEEDAPRVGYVHLTPRFVFVTFPVPARPAALWRGTELQAGDIMFHSRGERLHQRIPGPFVWGVIAVNPAQLEHYGRTLSGKPLSSPPEGRILRPSRRLAACLRHLHRQVCHLAETKSKILSHFEAARAIEQELIQTLVLGLTTADARTEGSAARRGAGIMVRFEEVLANRLAQPPKMPELCELLGVSERALRSDCAEFLGMSPTRYVLLRRLREVRSVLRDADPAAVNIAEVAQRFGFAEPGRFAGTYRATYGETPSATLRRTPGGRFAAS
jgi:AraC-like DNA-binding protein